MTAWQHKTKTVIAAALVGLVLIGAVFFGVLQWINSGKIVFGVSLAGLKIGGLKTDEAKNFLSSHTDKFNQQKIILIYEQRQWQFFPSELGFNFDLEKTVSEAISWGHRANLLAGIQEQLQALLQGKDLSAVLNFNQEQFNHTLSKFTPIIEEPSQNAKLMYEQRKNDFSILPEFSGKMINRQQLKNNLFNNFRQLSNSPIQLGLITDPPQVRAQDLELIKTKAQALIEQAPYFIKTGDFIWPIDKSELTQWISALPSLGALALDQDEIKNFLSPLASSVNQKPTNAKLTFINNQIEILTPSQNGKELNLEVSAQKIAQDILNGEKSIELALDSVEPEITDKNINDLGLTSLLGRGESNFAGSPKNRQFNITLGSPKLNGWLIKPGEEFSFNQSMGPVDEKSGFLPELVIIDKKTLPDYGGGLCQISTTLFRAAVNAGLKITERFPHAYPVRYYNPPGFDATVYPPQPDLKFLNDTLNYLLVQNKIEGSKLIFEIYGSRDGREVKIIGPKITESNPDGSMKTILTQEIWREGTLERQNIFRSSYKSPSLYPIATSTQAN